MSELLDKARAKLRFALLGKVKSIVIEEIPKQWEHFMSSKDKWINVGFPDSENMTACLYVGMKGSEFGLHKHNKRYEHFTILNKKGHIRVVTKSKIKEYKFPESVYFKEDEPHFIEFLHETKILCMWHPKMIGWRADFISNEK